MLTFQACKKEDLTAEKIVTSEQNLDSEKREVFQSVNGKVKVGTLTATLPEGFDEKIFNYTDEEKLKVLERIMSSEKSTGAVYSINDVADFVNPVLAKYPLLEEETFSDAQIQRISSDFGGVEKEVIIENAVIIDRYYEQVADADVLAKATGNPVTAVIDKYEENADLLNFYEKMVLLASLIF